MQTEKYNPNSLSLSAILGLIALGDIAIPEIQRPFVWKKQVRDLLDSLYKGYPTGYLIIWKKLNVKLKDGSMSAGKKFGTITDDPTEVEDIDEHGCRKGAPTENMAMPVSIYLVEQG